MSYSIFTKPEIQRIIDNKMIILTRDCERLIRELHKDLSRDVLGIIRKEKSSND